MDDGEAATIFLCASEQLIEGADAVPFDVVYCGHSSRGFAVRYGGEVHAYLNRCTHVPMEMDYQPNKFFDLTGHWLICATHGAMYNPRTGQCRGGPCRGGLFKIALSESDNQVCWHTTAHLQPVHF
jgi:nitrite reductase/ring-hydroxylating ferredoxin subunit